MNHDQITKQEIDEIAGQIARRRLASPEFADVVMIKAEAERIGARIRHMTDGGFGLGELKSLVSDLSRHQRRADRVFRKAVRRARA